MQMAPKEFEVLAYKRVCVNSWNGTRFRTWCQLAGKDLSFWRTNSMASISGTRVGTWRQCLANPRHHPAVASPARGTTRLWHCAIAGAARPPCRPLVPPSPQGADHIRNRPHAALPARGFAGGAARPGRLYTCIQVCTLILPRMPPSLERGVTRLWH